MKLILYILYTIFIYIVFRLSILTISIIFVTKIIISGIKSNKLKNGKSKFNRITVKVGSNVITMPDGSLNSWRMSRLVQEIATITKQGTEIVLGRNVLNKLRVLLDGPAGQTDIRS